MSEHVKLFVSGPNGDDFRPMLVVKPSPEALGNNIDLIDWSPDGNRLLLAQGVWQWGSDAGAIMVRIYDAESKNLSREFLVDEAFTRLSGKNCTWCFLSVGFYQQTGCSHSRTVFRGRKGAKPGGRLPAFQQKGILAYGYFDSGSHSTFQRRDLHS